MANRFYHAVTESGLKCGHAHRRPEFAEKCRRELRDRKNIMGGDNAWEVSRVTDAFGDYHHATTIGRQHITKLH